MDCPCRTIIVKARRNITVRGVIYASIRSAAKELGISRTALTELVNDPKDKDFISIKPILPWTKIIPSNEGREHGPEVREAYREAALIREAKLRQPVSVKGVLYPNVRNAAKVVGLSLREVTWYAEDPNQHDYFFVDSINPPA